MTKKELLNPIEVSLGFREKDHFLLEILLRTVDGVETQLKPPPLRPEEGNRPEGGCDEALHPHRLQAGRALHRGETPSPLAREIHLVLGNADGGLQGVPLKTQK